MGVYLNGKLGLSFGNEENAYNVLVEFRYYFVRKPEIKNPFSIKFWTSYMHFLRENIILVSPISN